MNTTNIIFYGIGGQGILKASELCSNAALIAGLHVKKSEVHGMAQRGGSVESHVRFGTEVYSPLVPEGRADILVCSYEKEHPRLAHFLKSDGIDLKGLLEDADNVLGEDKKLLNTYLVGALSNHLDFSPEVWEQAIKLTFPEKWQAKNMEIFAKGKKTGGA